MRSHKHGKQRSVVKNGFLRRRIGLGRRDPVAGNGWTVQADKKLDHQVALDDGSDSARSEGRGDKSPSRLLCPLAQDEIAISDAAEGRVGDTPEERRDFRSEQTEHCSPAGEEPEVACRAERKGEVPLETSAHADEQKTSLCRTSGCAQSATASSAEVENEGHSSGHGAHLTDSNRATLHKRPGDTSGERSKVAIGGIRQLVQEILGQLYQPFDQVQGELVRQARDILVCEFSGNLDKFRRQFLLPAARLLEDFKEKERVALREYYTRRRNKTEIANGKDSSVNQGVGLLVNEPSPLSSACVHCLGWPLSIGGDRLAVRLGEVEPGLLRAGDYYLFVRPARAASVGRPEVELVLKYLRGGPSTPPPQPQPGECTLSAEDFGQVFVSMEGGAGPGHHSRPDSAPGPPASDDQMTSLLQHMLVSVEKGIKRMRWELLLTSQMWTRGGTSAPPPTPADATEGEATEGPASPGAPCCCCSSRGPLALDLKDSGVQTSPSVEQVPVAGVGPDGGDVLCTAVDGGPATRGPGTGEITSCGDGECGTLADAENLDSVEISPKKTDVAVKWDCVTNGNSADLDDGYHDNSLSQPNCIFDMDEDLVKSEIATIPGCRDRTGRVVVTFNCALYKNGVKFSASQFTQLLMYYHSVPRKELAARGFLVLIDARSAPKEFVGILDEAFCLLEGNIAGAVNTVVFWKNAPPGTETSPRKITTPFPQSAVKFEVVYLVEEVKKVIKPDQLPISLGGEYDYDHQKWMEFRKSLEPFMQSCRSIGKRMIGVMQEMKGSSLPASATLTTQSIEQHKKFVGQVFDDPQLVQLQQNGPETLRQLEEARRLNPNNHDYRESVERCSALYSELQRAIVKLVRLADKRLLKLEHCLHLRTLEEDTIQVLSWLSKKGEETLNKHRVVANSLGGVKAQERDFEKFYFLAMRHIEKGNDLLEEAAMLGQNGHQDAFGMKDLAKSLKQHLGNFSTRLEDQREKLEDTSKCYQLLDKAYEWALEAMKFVSRLKMDQYTSPEQLSCLMKHLHHYLESHPPLGDETFTEMIELASKLGNERLLEQCKVAQVRCRETAELIRTRHQTLMKAKQQIEVECVRHRQHHQEALLDQVSEAMATHSPKLYQPTSPLWTPFSTSTPCYPYARRRSVSGLPYNLAQAPYSYFGAGHRRHESIGANLLISEEQDEIGDPADKLDIPNMDDDTSEDLVHSSAADCAKEEMCGSSASASSDGEGGSTDVSKTEKQLSTPLSSLSLSQTKKLMKRSQTWQFEDDVWDVLPPRPNVGHGQLTKNLPTRGSAESIPSITENDDVGLSHHNSKMGPGYPPVPVNTHLHQRGSSLNLQFSATSMADLRQSDEQLKQRRTVLLIMREMIQTERDYVKSLEYIIENYIPELLRDDIPQALRGKRNVIFGNIEKIYEFHNRYFLQELEQCENSPSLVGQCFLRHESYFYLYALYNKNKPKSDGLMAEYGSAFFKSKQLELGDKMDLASYLLKPVQRMGKYALLLKQLLKECPEKDPEYGTLTASKEMVNFQLRHGNDLLAMDAIRECDVNLKEQGCLLRQDEFLVWQGKSRKCLRQVFLFEDLILLSKARRDPNKKGHDVYQYKLSIKMTDIGLTEQLAESNTKFEIWFRKRKTSDTYTLQAPNPEVRQAWIQEISKLLWKQALRNREVRLAEMSSMGIGNKPCLDIKPSQDQISDRSISISQLDRAPKFRNSIAGAPSDYLRNNNKRPHSIISVSSSSSGSSQSSSGPYYGALNLGFDPSDSPKSRHRSVTQQSQCSSESGIIPDISLNYDSLTDTESHKKVGRSNSSTSNESIGICSLPMSPSTPASPEEDASVGSEGAGQ